jgi:hypothetical protein
VTLIAHTLAFMRRPSALLLTGLLAGSACERTHNLLSVALPDADIPDADVDADVGADAATDAGGFVIDEAGVVLCGTRPCACANGEDDDGDGLADGFDPECTGAYDQDELTFATGVIKEGNPRCHDCFFDDNSGPGDDGCNIAASCVLDGTTDISNGSCRMCTPEPPCIDKCRLRTPNGCDCFGCCQVQGTNPTLFILLDDGCSLDAEALADPARCPRCVQTSSDCKNSCERCELCPGKTKADLPSDCFDQFELGYDCQDATACSGTNTLCSARAWCLQGCCAPILY